MSNIQPYNLRNAAVVFACAITIGAVSTAQGEEQQTVSDPKVPYMVKDAVVREPLEIVFEPGALEHAKAESLSRKFNDLVKQWRDERRSMSSIDDMVILTPYQNIIGMGVEAVPLLLAQLKAEGNKPDQWFWALLTIAEANDLNPPQIDAADQGNYRKMAKAWLAWGENLGYAG